MILLRVLPENVREGFLHVASPQIRALGSVPLVNASASTLFRSSRHDAGAISQAASAAAADPALDHEAEWGAALGRAVWAARVSVWLPCKKNTPGNLWFRAATYQKMAWNLNAN